MQLHHPFFIMFAHCAAKQESHSTHKSQRQEKTYILEQKLSLNRKHNDELEQLHKFVAIT